MHADMVLKELKVLHLDLQAAGETMCHTRHSLSIGDCKAHYSDTLIPTRPHLLIVPLPMGTILFQTSTVLLRYPTVPKPFSKPFCLFAFNGKCHAETRA